MSDESILLSSLELAVERVSDPAAAIYQHLFARHPELESLFSMDRDGGVRGSMLEQAFDCLIDLTGDGRMANVILSMERENHDSYGVPDDLFMSLFTAMHAVIRDSVGDGWTDAQEAVWRRLLAKAETVSRQSA